MSVLVSLLSLLWFNWHALGGSAANPGILVLLGAVTLGLIFGIDYAYKWFKRRQKDMK